MSMLNEARRGSLTDDRDRSLLGRIKEIIPWKGDDIKEIIRKTVFIVAMGVLIYSAYDAYVYKFGSKSMIEDQRDIASLYNPGTPSPNTPDNTDNTTNVNDTPAVPEQNLPVDNASQEVQQPVSKYPAGMLSNFEVLYDTNPDVVGFIYIDGIYVDDSKPEDELELAVNYPVVQSDDNDYYLEHDFYNKEKNYGALFADFRADVTVANRSDNITIYGHNMGSGYYFARLHDYKKSADFVAEHNIVNFNTLYSEDEYVIFACFLVSVNEEDDNQPIFRYHNAVNFADDAAFDYWYKNVLYRNYYVTDIDCNINDEYLTLSTCSTEFYDSRFVIVARKLRDGEDPSVYTYRSNSKAHKPAKFYWAYGNDVPHDNGPDYEIYDPN